MNNTPYFELIMAAARTIGHARGAIELNKKLEDVDRKRFIENFERTIDRLDKAKDIALNDIERTPQ